MENYSTKIGASLFPLTLQCLDEEVKGLPMTDILQKLEKLGFLESAHQWRLLRESRNIISHDYPLTLEETAAALNQVWEDATRLITIYNRIKTLLNDKGWQTQPETPPSL